MRWHYRLNEAAAPAALLELLAALGHARRDGARRLKRSLLDTFDGRLADAGLVLEAAQDKKGALELSLREAGDPRGDTWPAAQLPHLACDIERPRLRARLERITEQRALLVRGTASCERHRLVWHDAHAKRIATVDLEVYRIRRGQAALALLTIRPVQGFERACARLLGHLTRSKLVTALTEDPGDTLLAALGAPAPCRAKPLVELDRGMPAAAALAALFEAYGEVMWANEPGIIDNLDTEFLHDYRVALRSIRSWHGDLRKVVAKSARARGRTELAELNRITGRLRDLDVLAEQLPVYLAEGGGTHATQAAALAALVGAARDRARRAVVKHFRSHHYRAFRRRWQALATDLARGRQTGRRGDARLHAVVLEALRRRHARVVNFDWSRAQDEPAVLHELRKECKKLRYLLEGFQRLFDATLCRRAIVELKKVQTAMGDTWDLHVHHALLRELAAALPGDDARARAVLPVVIGLETRLTALEHAHCELVTRAFDHFRLPATQRIYRRLLEQP